MLFLAAVTAEVLVKKINELTRFLAGLAAKAEEAGTGIYDSVLKNEELQKLAALDPNFSAHIKNVIKMYVHTEFNEMMNSICTQIALLLLEIKNQHDSSENDGTAPDIKKLDEMAAKTADKFRILVDFTKRAITSVDWDHVAATIVESGERAADIKAKKTDEECGDSPFSLN